MSPADLIDVEKEILLPDDIVFSKAVGKTQKSAGTYYANRRQGSVYFKTNIHCKENGLPVIKKDVAIVFFPKTQDYKLERLLILPDESETGDSLRDFLMTIEPRGKHRCHDIEDESKVKEGKIEKIKLAICDRLKGAVRFNISKNGIGTFWQQPSMGQFYVRY